MSNELVLIKAVWEIRFQPSALFFDNRGRILDRWYKQEGFEHWLIHQNQIKLHDDPETHAFIVMKDRMVYEATKPTLDEFCTRASRVSAWVATTLKVKHYARLGFRIYLVSERDSFENTFDSMMGRMFALNADDLAVFGGKPVDVAVPFTLKFDDRTANFKLGPIVKSELVNKDLPEVDTGIPDVGVLFDFDMYQENPAVRAGNPRSDFHSFLSTSGKTMWKISGDVLDHFGGFES